MRNNIIYLLILIVTILEGVFIPWPLTLLTIICYSVLFEDEGWRVAFIAGLLLDIFSGRVWGVDSAIFLLIDFLISSYRKKIVAHTVAYVLPFSTIIIILYTYIFQRRISVWGTVLSLLAGILLFFLLAMIESRISRGKKLSY